MGFGAERAAAGADAAALVLLGAENVSFLEATGAAFRGAGAGGDCFGLAEEGLAAAVAAAALAAGAAAAFFFAGGAAFLAAGAGAFFLFLAWKSASSEPVLVRSATICSRSW